MPRREKGFSSAFKQFWASLGLYPDVRRHVPDAQDLLQRLRNRLQQVKGREQIQRLQQQLQQEKERRLQAESFPEPDTSTDDEYQIFRTLISALKPGKMLDLGAAHGRFSLIAAELGWEVTAVDARTGRTPDPERGRAQKDPYRAELIRSVSWIEADVREFPIRSGEYDLICILGLLHHFELEDQIKLLERCSDTLTLLKTRIIPKSARLDTEGFYSGRYFREAGETREERDQIQWASWGNEVSFKHTEESLLRLARNCGYSRMWSMRPPHERQYTFYLFLPSP